jgi:hypothetical protein
LSIAGLLLGAAATWSTPAFAQATRTWVSGVGDDVNPCSRTAPCKTFAGAISKTAAGGEINCLDPGGFGAVTITKAMTIDCHYTEGGVLAGGNGITVNALSTDAVFLRGLDIFGVNPPSNGVRFIAGGELHIEDCVIRRFNAANSFGVSYQPSNSNARLYIVNTTIANNGNGATGGGILIQPTGGGTALTTLRNVRIRNNANIALRIDSTGDTGSFNTTMVDDVELSGNGGGIAVVTPTGNTPNGVMIRNSAIIGNGGNPGISADGGFSTVRVSGTAITGNTLGVQVTNSAAVFSYGDNLLDGNPNQVAPNNGAFTGAVIPKR